MLKYRDYIINDRKKLKTDLSVVCLLILLQSINKYEEKKNILIATLIFAYI